MRRSPIGICASERVPHLTGAQIMAPADLDGVDAALAADVRIGRQMLEEFLAADTRRRRCADV